jgi:predicted aconitase
MELSRTECALRDGVAGPIVAEAIAHQIVVGDFFGAKRFVPVSNVHIAGDYEMMGEAGSRLLRRVRDGGASFAVPVTTNAKCVDFDLAERLQQDAALVASERELQEIQRGLGSILVNTCINYQTVYQPHIGEHVAWGDTGTVTYANAIFGARTNYESGFSAIAAGLTGLTPAYGFHVDKARLGTVHVRVEAELADVAEWGALGAVVGRQLEDYWAVPVFDFSSAVHPSADDLKHLCTSIASYGSTAMFHIVGHTPEAATLEDAFGGRSPERRIDVDRAAIDAVFAGYPPAHQQAELVVFSGPQLSLFELRRIAALLENAKIKAGTTMIVTTNAANWEAANQLGYIDSIAASGAIIARGTCWYIMTPGEMGKAFGWTQVVTNSAKLANIIGGYRYTAVLRTTEQCVRAAISGSIV